MKLTRLTVQTVEYSLEISDFRQLRVKVMLDSKNELFLAIINQGWILILFKHLLEQEPLSLFLDPEEYTKQLKIPQPQKFIHGRILPLIQTKALQKVIQLEVQVEIALEMLRH